jgi:ATP-dependent Clp protease adaptor protein ClpS
MTKRQFEYEDELMTADDDTIKKPQMYQVIMHNDNYTTMEFVIEVLMRIFHHARSSAETLMITIHEKGEARAGTYPLEIAETKVAQTMAMAREEGFPLKCSIQPE